MRFRLVDRTKDVQRYAWAWFKRRPGVSLRELVRYQRRRDVARRARQ